ncbi:MAG: type III-B CRISPR module RAMP protein Cmr1 [Promethearchaeota archaeon]
MPLETTTPLINPGACKHHVVPEGVRAPSVRGVLRWWFRALVGSYLDLPALRALEGFTFGTAEERGVVSTATRTVVTPKPKPKEFNQLRSPGVKYLLYSLRPTREDRRRRSIPQFVPPPLKFDVAFTFSRATFEAKRNDWLGRHPGAFASDDQFQLNELRNLVRMAAFVWVHFGGVGSRTRRGAGRVALREDVDGVDDATRKMFTPWKEDFTLDRFLSRRLKLFGNQLKKLFGERDRRTSPREPGHAVLSSGRFRAFVDPVGNGSWNAALEVLHERYAGEDGFRFLRFDLSEESDEVRRAMGSRDRRVAFGLPVVFGDDRQVSAYRGGDEWRRASPLWLGVVRWRGKYHPTVAVFGGQFLPRGVEIRDRDGPVEVDAELLLNDVVFRHLGERMCPEWQRVEGLQ